MDTPATNAALDGGDMARDFAAALEGVQVDAATIIAETTLNADQRAILDFERSWWSEPGPKERTIKVPSDAKRKRLENLYAQVRKIRESQGGYERLGEIWETQQAEHPEDWLLSMEIFEILDATDQQRELKTKIEQFLNEKKATTKDLSTLISWGFRLVDYHNKPEYQAALEASPK